MGSGSVPSGLPQWVSLSVLSPPRDRPPAAPRLGSSEEHDARQAKADPSPRMPRGQTGAQLPIGRDAVPPGMLGGASSSGGTQAGRPPLGGALLSK